VNSIGPLRVTQAFVYGFVALATLALHAVALHICVNGWRKSGIFVGIVACKHPEPVGPEASNITVGKVQGEIKVGMSAASVAEILGSPNIVTTDEQRREVWIYARSHRSVDTSNSFGGTIIILGGQTSQRGWPDRRPSPSSSNSTNKLVRTLPQRSQF
jgi:hypothetical protein